MVSHVNTFPAFWARLVDATQIHTKLYNMLQIDGLSNHVNLLSETQHITIFQLANHKIQQP